MIRKTVLTTVGIFSLLLGGATVALAGPSGATLAEKCERCHGKNGNSDEKQVPSIAGSSTTYFIDTMKDFKRGKRPSQKFKTTGHKETDMKAIAKRLDNQKLSALGKYFAAQTWKPRRQNVDSALAKKGKAVYKKQCKKCHEDNGSNPDDDAGRLAGQWIPYLEFQLDQFIKGERKPPKKMKKQLKKLKKGDIPALIQFFASQQ